MTYPVPILSSWFLNGILEHTPLQTSYSNALLSKRFISYQDKKCSLPYTPLVRVLSFASTAASGEIVVVFNDASHKIMARLTREAIIRFEQSHGQRITFETLNRLMIIRKADLRFVEKMNRVDFLSVMATLGGCQVATVFLDIFELDYYVRDRVLVSDFADNSLQPVYDDTEYIKRFGRRHRGHVLLKIDDDGMISDENHLDEAWELK